jgi:hypothetical protein
MASSSPEIHLTGPRPKPAPASVARVVVGVAGTWLTIWGLFLDHPLYWRLNAWSVGAAMVLVAINSFWLRPAAYLNAVLAVWLAFSARFVFHVQGAALWNALVVAAIVFVASLLDTRLRQPD